MENEKSSMWKAKYLLDIENIDNQHQHYFSICSKIANLCDLARSGKDVTFGTFLVAIFEMRSYAFKHFLTEENLFKKYRYPNSFAHIELHDQYLEVIRNFTIKIKAYHRQAKAIVDHDFLAEAEELTNFALNWWAKHIMEEDRKYAEFINEVGREQAKEERHFGVKEK